ncbi:MAG: adenylate/guanylate cyclase domain-containing protein [Polyangiales bacterium]
MASENALDSVGNVLVNPSLEENTAIELAINLVSTNSALDHVALYTKDGALIDVIQEQGLTKMPLPQKLNAETMVEAESKNIASGKPVSTSTGVRSLLVIPLHVGDQVSGFAASLVSLQAMQLRVERLADTRFEGIPNSLFVVDEDSRILAHPNAALAAKLPPASAIGVVGLEKKALSGDLVESGDVVTPDGKVVRTTVALSSRPWAIVAQLPHEIAYASLAKMQRIILITTIIAVVLALLVSFAVAKQITQPIKELSEFAKDLAARRFDRRVTVNTRDELGILGDVMSSAAADLQASEQRILKEEAIRGDLGRYLPAELVDQVVRREQDMALGGQRREITVLFADVVSFTPLTDKLAAEQIVGLLNELFTILTEIVFRHGGTVDKFIGDCVMAIWGAPKQQPDHAALALAAAEDMLRWLEAGNRGWEQKYGVRVELAIGVNSGDAVVGNIGSETRMQYTAIGDAVNVAARLESIARPQQVLITLATKDAAGDAFDYRSLGPRQLTGRSEPVQLFEVRL